MRTPEPGRVEIEHLRNCRSIDQVGEAIADITAARIGWSSFGFMCFNPNSLYTPSVHLRSLGFSAAEVMDRFPDMLHTIQSEHSATLGLECILRHCAARNRWALDISELLSPRQMRRTRVFQEYWQPLGLQHQIVSLLRDPRARVLGFFYLARNARENTFSNDDLRLADIVRMHAELALVVGRLIDESDVSCALNALESVHPVPAFLFDATGSLLWMSARGHQRTDARLVRFGEARVLRPNRLLRSLSLAVGSSSRESLPLSTRVKGRLVSEGLLHSGEQLGVRHLAEARRPLVLVTLSHVQGGDEPRSAPSESLSLGAMERRVAQLASEGFAVLNISANLGIAESTVRTHLRRIYSKLGVHSRAELACRFLSSDSAEVAPARARVAHHELWKPDPAC